MSDWVSAAVGETFIKLLFYNYAHHGLTISSVVTILQYSTEVSVGGALGKNINDVYDRPFYNTPISKKVQAINFHHGENETKGTVARCRLVLESDEEIMKVIGKIDVDRILSSSSLDIPEFMSNLTTEAMCDIYNELIDLERYEGTSDEKSGFWTLATCHRIELAAYLLRMKKILDFLLTLSLSIKDKEKLKNNFKKLVKLFDISLRKKDGKDGIFSNIFYPAYIDTFSSSMDSLNSSVNDKKV
jgi:hypothetical protein